MHCPRAVSDLRVGDQSTSARTHESAARPPFLCPTHFVPHFAFLGLALPLAHSPPSSPVSSSASLRPRRGLQCPNPARDGLFIVGVGRFAPTAASLIYFEARDTQGSASLALTPTPPSSWPSTPPPPRWTRARSRTARDALGGGCARTAGGRRDWATPSQSGSPCPAFISCKRAAACFAAKAKSPAA